VHKHGLPIQTSLYVATSKADADFILKGQPLRYSAFELTWSWSLWRSSGEGVEQPHAQWWIGQRIYIYELVWPDSNEILPISKLFLGKRY